MTARHIVIAAATLLHLSALSLDAQVMQQALVQPTEQTRQQLTKTLQEARQKKDRHGEALTLLQLGLTEAGLGNVDSARTNLAEAGEKMHAQNDPVGEWIAHLLRGQIEMALGKPADALRYVEKALAVLSEAKSSTAPFTLKTFLAFAPASGVPPQMLDDSNAALMKPMLIQFSLEPVTHDLYGSVLTQVGKLEQADAELKAAAAGAGMLQGMYDFSIESHFGDLRFRQQRYDEARTHYVKALNAPFNAGMFPAGSERQIKGAIYDRLARLETITGHPEEAKRWSEKAREVGTKRAEGR